MASQVPTEKSTQAMKSIDVLMIDIRSERTKEQKRDSMLPIINFSD